MNIIYDLRYNNKNDKFQKIKKSKISKKIKNSIFSKK